jgi:drug/metabolite transporter (DMT)-like permease
MRARSPLALLVVVWAISWPVIRVRVGTMPPIWFACLRYAIATVVLAVIAVARASVRLPTPSDACLVFVSGLLQMAAYAALTSLALTWLPPGRASVLAFSTPPWVVPLAVWRGQERPSWRLSLAPWQTLVATVPLGIVAVATEGRPPAIDGRGLMALAYVGPCATAFAYWGVVEVGRALPASTVSAALLATPTPGVLISAETSREPIGASGDGHRPTWPVRDVALDGPAD